MTSLSPASARALSRLRHFTPPPTSYPHLPLPRRAAVLILLYADPAGDLRVVLTIRSSSLRNYAGQAALPGGKADALSETPWQTARREAWEEIGLSRRDEGLPEGYGVEELTELPCNLAMTELGVRPCVAFLRTPKPSTKNPRPDAGRDLLPRLDAKEVAAVFTAPFYNFLRERDVDPSVRRRVEGTWYKGSWHSWHESAWRMHQFFVPVTPETVFLASRKPPVQPVVVPKAKREGSSGAQQSSALDPPLPASFYKPAASSDPLQQPRYRVFGMTARILVDAARVAYGEEPEFEHNSHFGDEEMILRLLSIGRLSEKRTPGETLTRDVMVRAGRSKIDLKGKM